MCLCATGGDRHSFCQAMRGPSSLACIICQRKHKESDDATRALIYVYQLCDTGGHGTGSAAHECSGAAPARSHPHSVVSLSSPFAFSAHSVLHSEALSTIALTKAKPPLRCSQVLPLLRTQRDGQLIQVC